MASMRLTPAATPVSERTLRYSQVIGLVLILSLMVYVTYNDIARWFLTG